MKSFTDLLTYVFFRFFVFLFRLTPFRALYILSDFLKFLFYHVVGYRKKVVYANLANSFPGKDPEEIKRIAGGFYSHLCDVLIESIKSFSMSEEEVAARYKFFNTGFLDELYGQNRSVIVVAGHYNNWEWAGIASGTQMRHRPVGFYKPLSNRYVDAFMQRTRVKGRSVLVSINDTVEVFRTNWGEPAAFYMISDQSPSSTRLAYWVNFMNQETATLHGPEKYARVNNYPVVFVDVQKVKRGFYTVEFLPLCMEPLKTKTGEITQMFMTRLEEQIRKDPQYYLWSHRRWKHKRNQGK
jgi:Kdo2-lipid IVA lauroyltransferase/acyltransferase